MCKREEAPQYLLKQFQHTIHLVVELINRFLSYVLVVGDHELDSRQRSNSRRVHVHPLAGLVSSRWNDIGGHAAINRCTLIFIFGNGIAIVASSSTLKLNGIVRIGTYMF